MLAFIMLFLLYPYKKYNKIGLFLEFGISMNEEIRVVMNDTTQPFGTNSYKFIMIIIIHLVLGRNLHHIISYQISS